MLSESRYNALSAISGLYFYDEDCDNLTYYYGEDKRLECVYVSVPDLKCGGYRGGIQSSKNIEYLKESLEDDHWVELTGFCGYRELLLNATGKYYAKTLRAVSALEAYATLYCEDEDSELEYDGYALEQ